MGVTLSRAGVRDVRRVAREFRGVQRIAVRAVDAGADVLLRKAERRNFGFTDRTGQLRRSLRVEQARVRGRFAAGKDIVASTPYARYVEHKPRTRDQRPGPPYWLGRAEVEARRDAERAMARSIERDFNRITR